MSTFEQRLWLFTSTKMPRVKVPGSPVSWIATCIPLITMVSLTDFQHLVGEGTAERGLSSARRAVEQAQPGGAHLRAAFWSSTLSFTCRGSTWRRANSRLTSMFFNRFSFNPSSKIRDSLVWDVIQYDSNVNKQRPTTSRRAQHWGEPSC